MDKKHLVNMLIEAREDLLRVKTKLDYMISKGPASEINIKCISGKMYVYKRTGSSQTNGTYIRKNNFQEIRALVQKLYNTRLRKAVFEESEQIQKCIAILGKIDTDELSVLNSIPKELQRFVNTELLEDKRRTEEWKNEVISGSNPFKADKTYVASDGTGVRSKSELIIAEALIACKVPYFYERPFFGFHEYDSGRRTHNLFPDFTCLNRRTGKTYYWEHLGMMDNPEYAAKNVKRIIEYAREGVYPGSELILTFEASEVSLKTEYIRAMIRKYLL